MTNPTPPADERSGLVLLRPEPGETREAFTKRFTEALRKAGAPVPAADDHDE